MYELLLSATVKKEKMFFKYKYYQSLLIILIMPLATAAEPEIQELEEITVTDKISLFTGSPVRGSII